VRLHTRYEEGHLLDYKWTRRNSSSIVMYKRTRTRRVVTEYLDEIKDGEKNPLPPAGVFKAELADEAFAKQSENFGAMSAAMIEKRGCGNPRRSCSCQGLSCRP
jgi:hypothetical protein